MSDLLNDVGHCSPEDALLCPAIRTILHPVDKDLGGFSVRRLLPADTLNALGPFVFFDHLGPAQFTPGAGIDVRPHPHIGLATITYLFAGELLHRDSLGHVQPIRPGEINWMTAGRGIVHSERTPPALRATGHSIHALQLWVALPEALEETAPAFFHHGAGQLPTVAVAGGSVRVLIGAAFGAASPVVACSPTLCLEVRLDKGAVFPLPEGVAERGLYVVAGAVRVQGKVIAAHRLAVFTAAPGVELQATEECRLVVLGGDPLGKRTVWWNLVATRRELIERAKADWQAGRFPPVPGESEFIPLPGS